MAVIKHDIPILEYDRTPAALLRHDRMESIRFPKRAVYAFLGDTIDNYAAGSSAQILDVFETISGKYPIYRIQYKGQELCLCKAPLGGAAAVQLMDWLIGHGVQSIISAGSCGALVPLPENTFLVPKRALRDEGASYHYLPPSRYVSIAEETRAVIKKVLHSHGFNCTECVTWSTDGFFRETADMVAYRREEGCSVVEMECASLAACAQFRGVKFGQLLYTADTLADAGNYAERDWGMDSMMPALQLCLEIAIHM